MLKGRTIIVVAISMLPLLFAASLSASPWDEAYAMLDRVRNKKKAQLLDYLEKTRQNAQAVTKDPVMLNFFYLKNKYYQLQKTISPSVEIVETIKELKRGIRAHYIRNYIAFYDVLFINRDGDIFYTIRQQADYHKNLFEGRLKQTALARQLLEKPLSGFVDYQFYDVSAEPSSFFVVPVIRAQRLEGWMVFQLAINKINNIFTQDKELGRTGEVFLVNEDRFMLTDSRFDGRSSILRRDLSRENILTKFKEKKGHRAVVDYRGYTALSSFEVCRVEQSRWLLIAKIDEDEILTGYYKENEKELDRCLLDTFKRPKPGACERLINSVSPIMVDMDEFRKAEKGETLRTFGVSTCTVCIVSYKGRFAYMSHISNLDKIYGGRTTDLIGNMLKRIETFDIYPYEKRNLDIILVASHLDTVENTLHLLVEKGFLLSQVCFMLNPNAEYASPVHDCHNGLTSVKWLMDRATGATLNTCSVDEKTIAELIKPMVERQSIH